LSSRLRAKQSGGRLVGKVFATEEDLGTDVQGAPYSIRRRM
jgi:hypothetical protein